MHQTHPSVGYGDREPRRDERSLPRSERHGRHSAEVGAGIADMGIGGQARLRVKQTHLHVRYVGQAAHSEQTY